MQKQPADKWYARDLDEELGLPYDRFWRDGYQWRVETDGRGQLVEVREKWVGFKAYEGRRAKDRLPDVPSLRQRAAVIAEHQEQMVEKHPDVPAAIVRFLALRPMTAKQLSWETGRSHQSIIDVMNDLRRRGRVCSRNVYDGKATESLWSLTTS